MKSYQLKDCGPIWRGTINSMSSFKMTMQTKKLLVENTSLTFSTQSTQSILSKSWNTLQRRDMLLKEMLWNSRPSRLLMSGLKSSRVCPTRVRRKESSLTCWKHQPNQSTRTKGERLSRCSVQSRTTTMLLSQVRLQASKIKAKTSSTSRATLTRITNQMKRIVRMTTLISDCWKYKKWIT